MKGFGRNIRCGLWQVAKVVVITYSAAVALTLWFWFLSLEETNTLAEVLDIYVYMSVLLGVAYILIYGAYEQVTLFNQQVSYGCTRLCAAFGLVFINAAESFIIFAINMLLRVIFHFALGLNLPTAGGILFMIDAFLIVMALTPFAELAVLYWGKIGYYVVVCGLCLAAGGAGGFLMGSIISASNDMQDIFSDFMSVPVNLIVMLIAFVINVIAALVYVKVTRKYAVR